MGPGTPSGVGQPAPLQQSDPRGLLRFRLFIGGYLIDQAWAQSPAQAEGIGARHEQLAVAAERGGAVWLIEVFDPDEPADAAYLRFGTDADMMTAPAGPLADHLHDLLKGDTE
jgi:hypothetical protein